MMNWIKIQKKKHLSDFFVFADPKVENKKLAKNGMNQIMFFVGKIEDMCALRG